MHVCKSFSSFGATDLDYRLSGVGSLNLQCRVQRCQRCGYAAPQIEEPTDITAEWIREHCDPLCEKRCFTDETAETIYRACLIAEYHGSTEDAYRYAHYAAWVCDDVVDDANAVFCRELAARHLRDLDAACMDENAKVLILADLLRRSGHFDEVADVLTALDTADTENRFAKLFQINRAAAKDSRRYNFEDVGSYYCNLLETLYILEQLIRGGKAL